METLIGRTIRFTYLDGNGVVSQRELSLEKIQVSLHKKTLLIGKESSGEYRSFRLDRITSSWDVLPAC